MEYQKITNLLGHTSDKVSRFNTKKWIEVHDQFWKNIQYYQGNKI